ncbi:2Fe-2S iron-sulfur cluster-binding protein [Nocardia africana]|uniref:Toluene-4-monooxygenase electron transfer component n=1 Tax=Nocardia africana TaxID=134964 RepID=A0A378WNK0_9NOCA|nr:2Fe-2S iron-sulfur cluster-binding protein [Nocardia africana]MCC3314946.1 2Fe-2S iron-sulfur cluster-binding protein [Nocardia africana]SUA42769.1 Toluene-4-monooxygenase electron transfer component [Nocardia africana]
MYSSETTAASLASGPLPQANPAVTVTTTDGASFGCAEGDTLLRAALRGGVPAAYECNSGGCGSCKFVLRDGEVDQLDPDAPGLSDRDRRKGKMLACQSVPRTDCTVALTCAPAWPPGHPRPNRFSATVVALRELTHDMVELTLESAGAAEFLPGQYAMVSIDGVTEHGLPTRPAERAYSMSNLPNPGGVWQFQIKRVPGGTISPYVTEQLGVGDQVRLDGPFGHAHLRRSERDVVCIAGGSGLAPMVSVARGLAARADAGARRLHFFYGGRGAADMCAREFVDEVTPSLLNAFLSEAISGEPDGDWTGARGYVHELLAAYDLPDLADHDIYVAGPPVMTDAVVRFLVLERQVPAERVHFDRFF